MSADLSGPLDACAALKNLGLRCTVPCCLADVPFVPTVGDATAAEESGTTAAGATAADWLGVGAVAGICTGHFLSISLTLMSIS